MKEGSRSTLIKGPADDDNDELHVYISGETEEAVSSACFALVACLLLAD